MKKLTAAFLWVCLSLGVFTPGSSRAVAQSQSWPGYLGQGIRETTAQIMERERLRNLQNGGHPPPHPVKPFRGRKGVLREVPSAGVPSGTSAAAPSAPVSAPEAKLVVAPKMPQFVTNHFTAFQSTEPAALYPPDTMGAVGLTQILVTVNSSLKLFDKATGALGPMNVSTDTFFANVMTPTAPGSPATFMTDPRVRYDRLSKRWFIVIIDNPNSQVNRIMIAMSDGPTVVDATTWTIFFFQQDQASSQGDTGDFADQPSLGIDANALYIGANIYTPGPSGTYTHSSIFVVNKAALLAGSLAVTAFRNITNLENGPGPFTPQGVDNYDPNAQVGYFLGVDVAATNQLSIIGITNPGGIPQATAPFQIPVDTFQNPLDGNHLGNSSPVPFGRIETRDCRLYAAHLRNGRLWTALHTACDQTGNAQVAPSRDGARWYEIDVTTNAVVQTGTLVDSTNNPPAGTDIDNTERYYIYPTVMVSGQGHMALGATTCGAQEYLNAFTTGRLRTDPQGQLRAGGDPASSPTITQSSTAYNNTQDGSLDTLSHRWGDYSYTALDPSDDMTMWTFQEWCSNTNTYGVEVARLQAPAPASLATVSPNSIGAGLLTVDLDIIGTSVLGSEFYDPGPGFPGRLAAAISGGVQINSVTYLGPTHMRINVSTVGATPGPQQLTVANPDGQVSPTILPVTILPGGGGGTPVTCRVDGPASPTNQNPIMFTLTFSENVSGLTTDDTKIQVTNGTKGTLSGGPMVYTLPVSPQNQGDVTCTVLAGAAAGVDGPNQRSNTADIVFDSIPPATPAAPTLDPGSDSGISNSDRITNVKTPIFTGSTEPGALVRLFDGTVQVGSGQADGTGSYRITSSSLPDGVHSFTVDATDAAGNTSARSAATQVTLDTVPPVVTLISPAPNSTLGTHTPLLQGTTKPGALLSISEGSTVLGPAAADGVTGAWSFTTPSLPDGMHTLSVVATDIAGNVGPPAPVSFTIDTVAPVVVITSPPSGAILGTHTPTLQGTTKAGSTLAFSEGASGLGSTVSDAVTGAWSFTTPPLPDGPHTLTVTATDLAGNVSPPVPLAFKIDTSVPVVVIASPASGATLATHTPVLQGTTKAGATLAFSEGASALGSAVADGTTGAWSFMTPILADGVHTLSVTATDTLGLTSAPVTIIFSLDTTPPVIVISTPAPNASLGTHTPTLQGTTKPLSTLSFTEGSTALGSATAAANGSWSFTTPPLADGTHTLSAIARDTGGVTGPQASVPFTIDTVAPVVVITAPVAGATLAVHTPALLGTTKPGATLTVTEGAALLGTATASSSGTWSFTTPSLPNGTHTLTVVARDAAGNLSAPASITFTINDQTLGAGTVNDGLGADIDVQSSATTVEANWSGFTGAITRYEWAVGTTPGGQDVRPFTSVGLETRASTSYDDLVLALRRRKTYYSTVRASDASGHQVTASSNGVTLVTTDRRPPASPHHLRASQSSGAVTLHWVASPSRDVAGYRLWWKLSSDPWYASTEVHRIAGTTVTVSGLTPGIPYDFLLRAVDVDGNESFGLYAISVRPFMAVALGPAAATGGQSLQDLLNSPDSAGQTIVLGPGTYTGDILLPPGRSIQGDSAHTTILRGTGTGNVITVAASSNLVRISNLTLENGLVGVSAPSTPVALDHLIIHHMALDGISANAGLLLVNATLMSNGGDGVQAGSSATLRNCIVGKNQGMGVRAPLGSLLTYSTVYANVGGDASLGISGIGVLSSPAEFVDEPADDYRELSSSPTVSAGDPADPFDQQPAPRGTAINLGAYGDTIYAASPESSPEIQGKAASMPPTAATGGNSGSQGVCGAVGGEALLWVGVAWLMGTRRSRRRRSMRSL